MAGLLLSDRLDPDSRKLWEVELNERNQKEAEIDDIEGDSHAVRSVPKFSVFAGESTVVRALLDQGSEASFVSESVVQLLGLQKERTCVPLASLGASSAGTARSMTRLRLKSNVESSFEISTDALILPRLTSRLPAESVVDFDFEQFAGITLAEPQFLVSGKIDVILGADVYGQLLRPGLKRFSRCQLVAQNTAFGWVGFRCIAIGGFTAGGAIRIAYNVAGFVLCFSARIRS